METPERSLDAASEEIRKILGSRKYASTIDLSDIPRILDAAFDAVPDLMALADEWDKEATSHWSCGDAADNLRAFMRGEK